MLAGLDHGYALWFLVFRFFCLSVAAARELMPRLGDCTPLAPNFQLAVESRRGQRGDHPAQRPHCQTAEKIERDAANRQGSGGISLFTYVRPFPVIQPVEITVYAQAL